jgi:hypothetical protein
VGPTPVVSGSGLPGCKSSLVVCGRAAELLRAPDRAGLGVIHPQLPTARAGGLGSVESVGPPSRELHLPQPADTAEDRRDPTAWPADRVLDVGEGPPVTGSGSERVEQLPHEIGATVVEPLDLAGLLHRIVRGVLVAPVRTNLYAESPLLRPVCHADRT